MSGSESDPAGPERFVERDDRETQLGYGDGRLPLYIGLVWVAFIISYVVVMTILALPDFEAWLSR